MTDLGMSAAPRRPTFSCSASVVNPASPDNSAADSVVGIDRCGSRSFGPGLNWRACSAACGSVMSSPVARAKATALAASIGLPPPNEINTSGLARAAAWVAAATVKGVRSAHKISSFEEAHLLGVRSTGMTTETVSGRVNVGEFDGKEFLLNLDRAERAEFYKLLDEAPWEGATASGHWQVRDLCGHLIDVTAGYLDRFA